MKTEYSPETCPCCSQTTTYLIPVDRGTVDIVKAIASAIRQKGINVIHPRKEMENEKCDIALGCLTSNQVGNLTRPRCHGLIAKVKGNPGNYCLTTKGAKLLRGENIPRFAIMSKTEGHQVGYFRPEEATVNIRDFSSDDAYWQGIDFEIQEGYIVKDLQKTNQQQTLI